MKRSLLISLLAPVVLAGSLHAASDYLLEIDGIKGESVDSQRPGTIEIESFSWGATSTAGSGGGGTGKVSFSDIHFTAKLSKATPQLLLACASTNPIPNVKLYVRRSDAVPAEYYTIALGGVLVSSLKQAGTSTSSTGSSPNPPPPRDDFSLNFDRITVAYTGTDGRVTTGTAERETAR